jgi:hypothetical protein
LDVLEGEIQPGLVLPEDQQCNQGADRGPKLREGQVRVNAGELLNAPQHHREKQGQDIENEHTKRHWLSFFLFLFDNLIISTLVKKPSGKNFEHPVRFGAAQKKNL